MNPAEDEVVTDNFTEPDDVTEERLETRSLDHEEAPDDSPVPEAPDGDVDNCSEPEACVDVMEKYVENTPTCCVNLEKEEDEDGEAGRFLSPVQAEKLTGSVADKVEGRSEAAGNQGQPRLRVRNDGKLD